LPHNVEGLWEDASFSQIFDLAQGNFPPAIAEACTVSPVYAVGDRVVLKRGAEISPGGVSGYFQGGLPAGTTVEITGSFIESGVCDHWPIRVVSMDGVGISGIANVPGGRKVTPVGALGFVSEIAFQARDT
jgi:hypothetical protein